MVLAGAGTGKTTVVVERVRHLLATDASLEPENVLVLTYNEMDRTMPAGWRDGMDNRFELFDHIDPQVALPLADVEGLFQAQRHAGRLGATNAPAAAAPPRGPGCRRCPTSTAGWPRPRP